MIIVNFKNYKQGRDVLKLAKKIEKANTKIIVAVPPSYLGFVKFRTKLNVFAQHVDYHKKGKSTGFTIPEVVKNIGIKGSLLNHSEHKIPPKYLEKTIKRCDKLGLKIVVCASNFKEIKLLKKLKPWAIAFEDTKLIATKKSITKYDSKKIKEFVKILAETKIIPLCGAGIHSKEDYWEALALGCKGVLISSAVMKSRNPGRFLRSFKLK